MFNVAFFVICGVAIILTAWITWYRLNRYTIRIDRRMAAMKHLYTAFWRPDWLARLQATNQTQSALCDLVVNCNDMTAAPSECDCPACRETFLDALPTGTGKRYTFEQYLADVAKQERNRAAEQAERVAANNRGWSTTPEPPIKPNDIPGWMTKRDDGWRT